MVRERRRVEEKEMQKEMVKHRSREAGGFWMILTTVRLDVWIRIVPGHGAYDYGYGKGWT